MNPKFHVIRPIFNVSMFCFLNCGQFALSIGFKAQMKKSEYMTTWKLHDGVTIKILYRW